MSAPNASATPRPGRPLLDPHMFINSILFVSRRGCSSNIHCQITPRRLPSVCRDSSAIFNAVHLRISARGKRAARRRALPRPGQQSACSSAGPVALTVPGSLPPLLPSPRHGPGAPAGSKLATVARSSASPLPKMKGGDISLCSQGDIITGPQQKIRRPQARQHRKPRTLSWSSPGHALPEPLPAHARITAHRSLKRSLSCGLRTTCRHTPRTKFPIVPRPTLSLQLSFAKRYARRRERSRTRTAPPAARCPSASTHGAPMHEKSEAANPSGPLNALPRELLCPCLPQLSRRPQLPPRPSSDSKSSRVSLPAKAPSSPITAAINWRFWSCSCATRSSTVLRASKR